MSERDLHPREGARFLLERDGDGSDEARYRGQIVTPDRVFAYQLRLALDGSATITADGDAAPAELETAFDNLARSTARAARRKLDDGLPPWPPRILRWRGPGRG